MANSTKAAIVASLKYLAAERHLNKITVMDIMDHTHMTRQSFYYHFQDIHSVLRWILNQQLFSPHAFFPGSDIEAWYSGIIQELDRDCLFYREAFVALKGDVPNEIILEFILPAVMDVMGIKHPEAMSADNRQKAEFFCRAIATEFVYHVMVTDNETPEKGLERLRTAFGIIHQCFAS